MQVRNMHLLDDFLGNRMDYDPKREDLYLSVLLHDYGV